MTADLVAGLRGLKAGFPTAGYRPFRAYFAAAAHGAGRETSECNGSRGLFHGLTGVRNRRAEIPVNCFTIGEVIP